MNFGYRKANHRPRQCRHFMLLELRCSSYPEAWKEWLVSDLVSKRQLPGVPVRRLRRRRSPVQRLNIKSPIQVNQRLITIIISINIISIITIIITININTIIISISCLHINDIALETGKML